MDEKRTANQEEMAANQQAYNTDGTLDGYHEKGAKVIEIYSTQQENRQSEGVENPYTKLKDTNEISKNGKQSKTLIRTDVDSHQEFQTSKLQNQEGGSNEVGYTGSSLNITAYNVYEGDGSQATKPSSVVVGVAGSSGNDAGITGNSNNAPDWQQNYNTGLNRSKYNGLSDETLRGMKKVTAVNIHNGYPTNYREIDNPDWANVQYEIDMREKVSELKKYQDKHVPIILVGDSKGGEDAAYLALKSEQSGIPIEHLYLTNPKGIRLDGNENDENSDYGRLHKMAKEGKITVEVVYPEIVSDGAMEGLIKTDGSGVGDGRVIPGKRIYTVPNGLNTTDNHKIGSYEKNVYQGVGGNFKFQCDEIPEKIIKRIPPGNPALGVDMMISYLVYRYKVSRITDRSGKTISVTDYFFEEQKDLLNTAIIGKLNALHKKLEEFKQEDILTYFTEKARSIHVSLEDKHKAIIKAATPFSTFKLDHKGRFEGEKDPDLIEAIEKELKAEYNNALKAHVESESVYYPSAVSGVVSSYITKYQEIIAERDKQLFSELERVQQVIDGIERSKGEYKNSQKEIQLIIEKMM